MWDEIAYLDGFGVASGPRAHILVRRVLDLPLIVLLSKRVIAMIKTTGASQTPSVLIVVLVRKSNGSGQWIQNCDSGQKE